MHPPHRRHPLSAALLLAVLGLQAPLLGCTSGAIPPGPFVAQEGPRSVGKGRTRLDVAGGGAFGSCCGWIGGGAGGQARVRHGITDDFELGVSGSVLWFSHEDFVTVRHSAGPLTVAGQMDLKLTLEDHVAVVLNSGAVVSPIGSSVTGAAALVLGKPQPGRVEPYGQLRTAFSIPIGRVGHVPDETPGSVDPAVFLLAGAGMLIHFTDRTALALEAGGGGVFAATHGGAGYATAGVNMTLGDDRHTPPPNEPDRLSGTESRRH